MPDNNDAPHPQSPRTLDMFKAAPKDYQSLIRECIREERDVMHLRRRSDIHQRLIDHVKRVIK